MMAMSFALAVKNCYATHTILLIQQFLVQPKRGAKPRFLPVAKNSEIEGGEPLGS
jgi:hypothetical protein